MKAKVYKAVLCKRHGLAQVERVQPDFQLQLYPQNEKVDSLHVGRSLLGASPDDKSQLCRQFQKHVLPGERSQENVVIKRAMLL